MNRFRQQGGSTKSKGSWQSWDTLGVPNGNGSWASEKLQQSNIKSIRDVVIPKFKEQRSAGQVFMNPVTVQTADVNYPVNETVEVGPIPTWGRVSVSGSVTAEFQSGATVPSWVYQRDAEAKAWTLQEAYSKVASVDFQALVTVAEAGKTAKMLASPFRRTEELLNKIIFKKARLVKKGLDLGSAAASAWLEYRLGWKPLLYDIEGIWDAYIKNTAYFDKPVRLVARRSHTIKYDSGPETYSGVGPVFGTWPMLRRYTLESKISSGVLYELHDGGLEDAAKRNMGLRLADVPSSLWELVPLSFVVDRYLAVGSWLDAIVPKPGVTIKGSWTTRTSTSNLVQTRLPYPTVIAGTSVTLPGGSPCTERYRTLDRVANPSTALFAVPVWNPKDISLNQTRDHIALIYELFRGIGLTRK